MADNNWFMDLAKAGLFGLLLLILYPILVGFGTPILPQVFNFAIQGININLVTFLSAGIAVWLLNMLKRKWNWL